MLRSYQILERLADGGMGAVYRGEDVGHGSEVALKVLLPEFRNDLRYRKWLQQEARILQSIDHPGVVQALDFGYADDLPYLVMEYVPGETLRRRLKRCGALAPLQALDVALQLARALAAVHRQGVIHCDLKPSNIMLVCAEGAGGEHGHEPVKLIDFGVAQRIDSPEDTSSRFAGTPAYMAPEQCSGDGRADARSDVYGLGCLLFHMLCGRPPFVAGDVETLVSLQRWEPAPSLRAQMPSLPRSLDRLLARMLAKNPGGRPASMDALADELASLQAALARSHDATSYPQSHVPAAPGWPGGLRCVTAVGFEGQTVSWCIDHGTCTPTLPRQARVRGARDRELTGAPGRYRRFAASA